MYLITPYMAIDKLILNSPTSEIEKILGSGNDKQSKYFPDIEIGKYAKGITVEYRKNLSCFIGVLISLEPVHLEFNFYNKSYDDVMNYFKSYPGDIYIEGGETSIISEHLGISTYFEDGLKEVGIFSKSYREEFVKGL